MWRADVWLALGEQRGNYLGEQRGNYGVPVSACQRVPGYP